MILGFYFYPRIIDDQKRHSDDAVRDYINLRKEFADMFESLEIYDEKGRNDAMRESLQLLQETGVTMEIGLPIITAYTREFKGKMPQSQYEQGIKEMLGWGAMHPSADTAELINIMALWNMITYKEQGEFRRMIVAGAKYVNMSVGNFVKALSYSFSTAKIMNWTPQQTIEAIMKITKGEPEKQQLPMVIETMSALQNPQLPNESEIHAR